MIKDYKTIRQIANPLMIVEQVEGVTYDELCEIELPNGEVRRGKVLEVEGDRAVVQLFDSAQGINLAQTKVRFLGHPLSLRFPRICSAAYSTVWVSLSTAAPSFLRRLIAILTACP